MTEPGEAGGSVAGVLIGEEKMCTPLSGAGDDDDCGGGGVDVDKVLMDNANNMTF